MKELAILLPFDSSVFILLDFATIDVYSTETSGVIAVLSFSQKLIIALRLSASLLIFAELTEVCGGIEDHSSSFSFNSLAAVLLGIPVSISISLSVNPLSFRPLRSEHSFGHTSFNNTLR